MPSITKTVYGYFEEMTDERFLKKYVLGVKHIPNLLGTVKVFLTNVVVKVLGKKTIPGKRNWFNDRRSL